MKFVLLILLNINLVYGAISNFRKDRLFVKVKKGSFLPNTKELLISKKIFHNLYLIQTKNLIILENNLKNDPAIEYTQKDYIKKYQRPIFNQQNNYTTTNNVFFNDPKAKKQWHLASIKNKGIGANELYLQGKIKKQNNIIVAVVDTGVDYNHEDLKNRLWVNPNEIPDNGIDDDHNGYIDDIHGISTVNRDIRGVATNKIIDESIHGTHVAGIIAATQNNKIGIAGVAMNVKLMILKTVPVEGDETDFDVIESFLYAAKNGAKIINCSFGKKVSSNAVKDTIKYLEDKYDILVIVAAGNKNNNLAKHPIYPAAYSLKNMIVVGSSNPVSQRSYFSNYNKKLVDIFAPGSLIVSTIPNNKYMSLKGTSMATPVVSAIAAEIKAQFPKLNTSQLKNIIMKNVVKKSSLRNKSLSGGIINFKQSLIKAKELSKNL